MPLCVPGPRRPYGPRSRRVRTARRQDPAHAASLRRPRPRTGRDPACFGAPRPLPPVRPRPRLRAAAVDRRRDAMGGRRLAARCVASPVADQVNATPFATAPATTNAVAGPGPGAGEGRRHGAAGGRGQGRLLGAPGEEVQADAAFGLGGSMWSQQALRAGLRGVQRHRRRAAHAGTVVKAGPNGAGDGPAYGNAIVIRHGNGTYSQYAHLSRITSGSAGRRHRPAHSPVRQHRQLQRPTPALRDPQDAELRLGRRPGRVPAGRGRVPLGRGAREGASRTGACAWSPGPWRLRGRPCACPRRRPRCR